MGSSVRLGENEELGENRELRGSTRIKWCPLGTNAIISLYFRMKPNELPYLMSMKWPSHNGCMNISNLIKLAVKRLRLMLYQKKIMWVVGRMNNLPMVMNGYIAKLWLTIQLKGGTSLLATSS